MLALFVDADRFDDAGIAAEVRETFEQAVGYLLAPSMHEVAFSFTAMTCLIVT